MAPERLRAGHLWLKKPRKMRWEYRSPKEKLFRQRRQGRVVLPAGGTATEDGGSEAGRSAVALAFLLGKTKLENELRGLSWFRIRTSGRPETSCCGGFRRAMAGQVSEVQLEITALRPDCPHRIEEADGATTEFRFTARKEN